MVTTSMVFNELLERGFSLREVTVLRDPRYALKAAGTPLMLACDEGGKGGERLALSCYVAHRATGRGGFSTPCRVCASGTLSRIFVCRTEYTYRMVPTYLIPTIFTITMLIDLAEVLQTGINSPNIGVLVKQDDMLATSTHPNNTFRHGLVLPTVNHCAPTTTNTLPIPKLPPREFPTPTTSDVVGMPLNEVHHGSSVLPC